MIVLVACEYSGLVRDAFGADGHEALSCDLLETERPGPHYQGDVRDILAYPLRYFSGPIDLLIAHPPCTDLSVSGNRDRAAKWADGRTEEALSFVGELLSADVPHIALENPVSVIASRFGPSTQTVQPWQFGHGEVKKTCFWLRNLPKLVPTDVVDGREERVHLMGPGPDRWKERSRTFPGVAAAMAAQWGRLGAEQLDLFAPAHALVGAR